MKGIIAWLAGIGIFILVCLIMALPTMWLWNWLMPAIFGLCRITLWQALGINIFSGMLFRGFGKRND